MTSSSTVHQPRGSRFNPRSQLGSNMPADGYLDLGDHHSGVVSMVGAIRVTQALGSGTWERHDHGDEVLVLLSGSATMTLRDADGRTEDHALSDGDVLIIPRGIAHHATLHTPEVQVLFVTPRTGTREWSDATEVE